MKARNKLLSRDEYKGRETDCCDSVCPCRPCWHAHDCGYRSYSGWVVKMECATRYNGGCPYPLPEPQHVYEKADKSEKVRRYRRCQRCGQYPAVAEKSDSQ